MPQKSKLRLRAEELLQDFTAAQVAKNLFPESGYSDVKVFRKKIYKWKREFEESIKSSKEIISDYVKSTQSSSFHKLKSELGLHENEFKLPEPLDDEIKVHTLPTACNKILLLSDIHIPFHSVDALTAALKFGKERGANTIYLNGDTIDFYAVSRFEKEKRLRSLKNEIETTRELLSIIRSIFPVAEFYLKSGNHEARWNSYIRQNAKEFEDVDDFAFESVMRFEQNGIRHIGDRDFAKAGKLHILHGHELMQAVSPVNPARGVYLKAMQSTIVAHHHRTSEHSGKNIGGDFITCWSTGCLSQLRPKYNPLSSYNHGFAYVEVESSGDFRVENKRIHDGKLY